MASENSSILLQKKIRDNSEDLVRTVQDLNSWLDEMKRKEADKILDKDSEIAQCKADKKPKQSTDTDSIPKRTSSYDYKVWDNFVTEVGNLKSKASVKPSVESFIKTNLMEEAAILKAKGNEYVKNGKWEDAISYYSEAISCYEYDATYYANRGLCFLKINEFRNAEADCTSALELNPKYAKVLQRRVVARIEMKLLPQAKCDLEEILQLEPNNTWAKKKLNELKGKMKGTQVTSQAKKPDQSASTSNATKMKPVDDLVTNVVQNQNEDLKSKIPWPERKSAVQIMATNIPPHQRSKKPLITVPIRDVYKDKTKNYPENFKENDTNGEKFETASTPKDQFCSKNKENEENLKIVRDKIELREFAVPRTSVDFFRDWKMMNDEEKFIYMTKILPKNIPHIFGMCLDSDILFEILEILEREYVKHSLLVYPYLKALSEVQRFSILVLFMSKNETKVVQNLIDYCQTKKEAEDNELLKLKKTFKI